jgi:hypothetical protein
MQRPKPRVNLCAVCVLLLSLLFGVVPTQRTQAAGERWCPQETGFCAENAFYDYWRRVDTASNGHALEVLGYPIDSPRHAPNGQVIQFYERAVMEWHPENGVEYQVLLTRLGAVLDEGDARAKQPPDPCAGPCSLFAETNHTLRDSFRNYWVSNGGLSVFGFPLTEQVQERNAADGKTYTVQYFERNRFEYHPENAGTRYEVLLGRLGAELLAVIGGDVRTWPVVSVPDYGTPAPSPPPSPPSPPPSATPRPSPSASPSVTVTPSTGTVGTTFVAHGTGFPAGATVGWAISSGSATNSGSFGLQPGTTAFDFTITTEGSVAGVYSIAFSVGGRVLASASFTVTAPPSSAAAAQFKAQVVAAIDRAVPKVQDVLRPAGAVRPSATGRGEARH